jgi:RNA polymerase sigma factor (TIGR02999 family)
MSAIQEEDPSPAAELLPLVYDELRRIAASRLAREQPGQTLQATALVHEEYLRLVGTSDPGWNGRRHFFTSAALAMRRILIENARKRSTLKRGAEVQRIELDLSELGQTGFRDEWLDVEHALEELSRFDPEAAQVVTYRFFAGMTIPEIAQVMEVSPRKVDGLWALARAWLLRHLRDDSTDHASSSHAPSEPA